MIKYINSIDTLHVIYPTMIFLPCRDVANNYLIDHILHNVIIEIRSQDSWLAFLKRFIFISFAIFMFIFTVIPYFAKYCADSSTLISKSYVSRLSPEAIDVS